MLQVLELIAAVERHSSHPIATALCQAAAAAGIASGGARGQGKQQVGGGEKVLSPLQAAEKELDKQLRQLARLLEKRMISQDEYETNRESVLEDFGYAQATAAAVSLRLY